MVRVNLISPSKLADQHLIAEYDEILMLLGYVQRFPKREGIPAEYCLGTGHIRFFKDKLIYLKKRHELLKEEMRKRKFKPARTINLNDFPKELRNDWSPNKKDESIIVARLIEKLNKKSGWYRYYGENKDAAFFIKLLK